jgi:cysteine-rich repeat protein
MKISMPYSRWKSSCLAVGLLTLHGCGQVAPMTPRIDRLTPDRGDSETEVPVVISGRFALAKFEIVLGESTPRSTQLPAIYLDDVPLTDFKILGEGSIRVMVPSGFSAGMKALRLVDPFGAEATAAYEVTEEPTTGTGNAVCGDGVRAVDEDCDDGNLLNGDGCSLLCQVETGFVCPVGQTCSVCIDEPSCARCGDGFAAVGEACDDGNLLDADGCSKDCQTETNSSCARVTLRGEAAESVCALAKEVIYVSGDSGCVTGWEPTDDPFLLGTPTKPICTLLAAKALAQRRFEVSGTSGPGESMLYLAPGTYHGIDFNGEEAVTTYHLYPDVPVGTPLPAGAQAYVSITRGVTNGSYGHPLKVWNGAHVRVHGIQFLQMTSETILDALVALDGDSSRLEMERVHIGPSYQPQVPGVVVRGGTFELRRSRVVGNTGGGVALEKAQSVAIENSFLVRNGREDEGSILGSYFGGLRLLLDVSGGAKLFFVHNTVAGNWAGSYVPSQIDCGDSSGAKLYASLVRSTTAFRQNQQTVSPDCLFVYSNVSDLVPVSEIDPGQNFNEFVTFVDPDNVADPDFHLRVDPTKEPSMTVDWIRTSTVTKGLPLLVPTVDFDGQPRPMGAGWDVGADEVDWR